MSEIFSQANDDKQGSDEGLDSICPISDKFYENSGTTAIKYMWNPTASELHEIGDSVKSRQ